MYHRHKNSPTPKNPSWNYVQNLIETIRNNYELSALNILPCLLSTSCNVFSKNQIFHRLVPYHSSRRGGLNTNYKKSILSISLKFIFCEPVFIFPLSPLCIKFSDNVLNVSYRQFLTVTTIRQILQSQQTIYF